MRARGVHTYADYARVLDSDQREYDRLLDALTINVTKLFRNWETYARCCASRSCRRSVVAAAIRRSTCGARAARRARSRIRSRRCSIGTRERHGALARSPSGACSVLGTRHRRAVARRAAERGTFEEGDFSRYAGRAAAPILRARRRRSRSRPRCAEMVRFERRDLLAEAPPPGPHHLICCRNVLIYFDRETQERLFEKFHDALAPDGFLVLGKVETLLGRVAYRIRGRRRARAHLPAVCEHASAQTFASRSPTTRSGAATTSSRRSGSARASRSRSTTATTRIGGLAHILLPSEAMSRETSNPAKFPETVVPIMLAEMRAARRARRRAHAREDRRRREHVRPARATAAGINVGERLRIGSRPRHRVDGIGLRQHQPDRRRRCSTRMPGRRRRGRLKPSARGPPNRHVRRRRRWTRPPDRRSDPSSHPPCRTSPSAPHSTHRHTQHSPRDRKRFRQSRRLMT